MLSLRRSFLATAFAYAEVFYLDDRRIEPFVTNDFVVEQTEDYWLVSVMGEIDIATIPAFRSSLATWSRAVSPHAIVDLTECRYMDSTGISVLVSQRRNDPALGIVLPPEHKLQRLFHIAGLDKILNVFSSREAALEAARSRKNGGA